MTLQLTAIIRKVPEGYIGYAEEIPGANAQEATLEELRESLKEAAALVIEANRAVAGAEVGAGEAFRERIEVGAA